MGPTRLAEEVQGLITSIGRAFFFAGYLPTLLFVALNQYAVLPSLGLSGVLLPDVPEVPFLSGELLTTLLVPLFLTMLLVSLNTTFIRFFEGLLPWQRTFLLRRWQRVNERKSEQLYGELQRWRACHRDLLEAIVLIESAEREETAGAETEAPSAPLPSSGWRALVRRFWSGSRLWKWLSSTTDITKKTPATSPDAPLECSDLLAEKIHEIPPEAPFDCLGLIHEIIQEPSLQTLYECLNQIAGKIQEIHERIEEQQPVQTVPFQASYARPTALGNAFAIFEEYPFHRYGIDGVLFWPRLRQLVDDQLLSALDNQKMFLDFQVNLATLALIFALEAVVVGAANLTAGWWIAAGLALLVARLAYSAGVRVVRTMGTLVITCFDFYRGKLLEQFGLPQPTNLYEEYKTWLRLGAFLRRGEPLYWPGDLLESS
jgi:hypothetical protein